MSDETVLGRTARNDRRSQRSHLAYEPFNNAKNVEISERIYMSVAMSGVSDGLKVTITHGPSGAQIMTVPPLDNGGDGSSFSPTDLCAASFGACATAVMTLFARRNQIEIGNISFQLTKDMQAQPRTISVLTANFQIETDCSDEEFQSLIDAGRNCPVRLALGPLTRVDQVYQRAPRNGK